MVKLLAVLVLAARAMGQGYVCAEGGNLSGRWAEELFGWMVEKGGNEVVILGAVPLEEDSRPDVFRKVGAERVTSLVVTRENADSQEVYDAIARARVVFIRGGSQSRYVEWWTGTKTQAAIEAVYKAGGVVAGSSAGAAVLGEVDYDARAGSLAAREALADGRHENLTLSTGLLNLVPGVIFDTHFTERGRIARLPVMLAHCREDLKKDVLGIGLDPKTAVCMGPDGVAEVKGEGTVTLLRLTAGSKVKVEKGLPPMVAGVECSQLCAGYRFEARSGEVVARPEGVRETPAREPVAIRSRQIDGSKLDDGKIGSAMMAEAEIDAWLTRPPKLETGLGVFPRAIVVTRAWSDRRAANSMTGAFGAIASETMDCDLAVVVDEGAAVRVVVNGVHTLFHSGTSKTAVMVLDARRSHHCGGGKEPRRVPVVEGATLYLLGAQHGLALPGGLVTQGELGEGSVLK